MNCLKYPIDSKNSARPNRFKYSFKNNHTPAPQKNPKKNIAPARQEQPGPRRPLHVSTGSPPRFTGPVGTTPVHRQGRSAESLVPDSIQTGPSGISPAGRSQSPDHGTTSGIHRIPVRRVRSALTARSRRLWTRGSVYPSNENV